MVATSREQKRRTDAGAAARAALIVTVIASAVAPASAGTEATTNARGGEQRYEVTIAPPHRPGAESAPGATGPAVSGEHDAAPPASGDSARSAAEGMPASGGSDLGAPEDGAGGSDVQTRHGSGGAAGGERASEEQPEAAPGPHMALQVGAYRQHRSAEKLRDELSASFADVTIVSTVSGGEPLYRVRVGKLGKGPALEEMKRRLLENGYAAFAVPFGD